MITIAMPTRNAGDQFTRTLEAVMIQRYEGEIEYIALDSGSTDGTLERLHAAGVRVITMPTNEFDWGLARNRMFEEARGEIVVNLSQDAIPANDDWLTKLLAPLDDNSIAVSCGGSIPDPDRTFRQFQWEKNGYYYFTREIKKFTDQFGKGLSFANCAVRRSAWEQLGIGPQATGEDFQFQKRLVAAGQTIAFPDDAPVLHHHNYALRALWRRCRNEGLALRTLGCPYNEIDLVADLASLPKYIQYLRELRRRSLQSPAELLFPWLRPIAVYAGSRFARKYIWY